MGSNPVARIEETLCIKGLFSFEAVKNHRIRRALQGLQEIIWITGDYIDCKALQEIALREILFCKRFYFDACNLDKSVLEFNSISLL